MSSQSDPATELIAYASVLLLFLYFLSVGIGKFSEWRRRRHAPPEPEPAHSPQMSSWSSGDGRPSIPVPIPEPRRQETAAPDTSAVPASTPPRISTRMADAEIIALLSVQRTADGKHRFSANQIASFVGGRREEAMAQVRAIRGLPQFRATTPEQDAAREALGLQR